MLTVSKTRSPFIQAIRKDLALHAPGSKERSDLLEDAKYQHEEDVHYRDYLASVSGRPRGFLPSCPNCGIMVKRRPGYRWGCACGARWGCAFGASGQLDDEMFEQQYRDERKARERNRLQAIEQRWLDNLASFVPENPYRTTLSDGHDTPLYRSLCSAIDATNGFPPGALRSMLQSRAMWEDGGDVLLKAVLGALMARFHFNTFTTRPWLNVLRSLCDEETGQTDPKHLPSFERAWHLLDVAAGCGRACALEWREPTAWFTPNMVVEALASTDPLASFKGVSPPMRALVRRYVDVHYDLALSNLLATARRTARKPKKGGERVMVRLHTLRNQADHSPEHLEKWLVVRDRLVSLGFTTRAQANGNLLSNLLDSPALDEHEAVRWTHLLLDELPGHPFYRTSHRNDALVAAAGSGWTDVVDVLVAHGAQIQTAGIVALVEAVHCDRHAMIDHLLAKGVCLDRTLEVIDDYMSQSYPKRFSVGITTRSERHDHGEAMDVRIAVRRLQAREVRRAADEAVADLQEVRAAARRRL